MGPRLVRGGRSRDGRADLSPRPWWFGPEVLDPVGAAVPVDLVLLDRDGTLNERVVDGYVTVPEELVLLPGATRAMARLTGAGCRTVLVTNQRAIARGLLTREGLMAVHDRLSGELAAVGGRLDAIAVCPHAEGECACRKPRDGLFREVLARAPWADPARSLMIGDMPSDLDPAAGLGFRTTRVGEDHGIEAAVAALLGGPDGHDGPPEIRRGEGHVP